MRLLLVLDCTDADALANFWAAALGFRRSAFHPPYVRLVDRRGRWPDLLLQQVPEGKFGEPTTDATAPDRAHNKLHLDLHIGPERRVEVVDRLLSAGAAKLCDGEQGGSTWVTMADPEGNKFCVA